MSLPPQHLHTPHSQFFNVYNVSTCTKPKKFRTSKERPYPTNHKSYQLLQGIVYHQQEGFQYKPCYVWIRTRVITFTLIISPPLESPTKKVFPKIWKEKVYLYVSEVILAVGSISYWALWNWPYQEMDIYGTPPSNHQSLDENVFPTTFFGILFILIDILYGPEIRKIELNNI